MTTINPLDISRINAPAAHHVVHERLADDIGDVHLHGWRVYEEPLLSVYVTDDGRLVYVNDQNIRELPGLDSLYRLSPDIYLLACELLNIKRPSRTL